MASLTQWTWFWVNSGSWWWTGRPGILQFMGSQRVRHDWGLNWIEPSSEFVLCISSLASLNWMTRVMGFSRHVSVLGWCQGFKVSGSKASFLLNCMCVQSLQSCPTLCDSMDCSPPGSSVHGILQARILGWVAMPSSRGSSWSRDWTHVFCGSSIGGRFVTTEPQGSPLAWLNGQSATCGQRNTDQKGNRCCPGLAWWSDSLPMGKSDNLCKWPGCYTWCAMPQPLLAPLSITSLLAFPHPSGPRSMYVCMCVCVCV